MTRLIDLVNILDKPWNWEYLSSNPNITFGDVYANPDKAWSWHHLSKNSNITFEDVKNHPNKDWDWYELSRNPGITFKDIEKNFKCTKQFLNDFLSFHTICYIRND